MDEAAGGGGAIMSAHALASRRSAMLGGLGAVLAGLIVPALAAETNLDAELIAACQQYLAAMDEEAAMPNVIYKDGSSDALAEQAQVDAIVLQMNTALDYAADAPALTRDGIRAKAALIHRMLPVDADAFELGPESPQIRLVVSLAADILRRAA
jgi:hypothetical protein